MLTYILIDFWIEQYAKHNNVVSDSDTNVLLGVKSVQ